MNINSEKSQSFNLDGSEKIQVINKITKGVYATLTSKFEFKLIQIFGDKNWVVRKFTLPITESTDTKFTCKLADKKKKQRNEIFTNLILKASTLQLGHLKQQNQLLQMKLQLANTFS